MTQAMRENVHTKKLYWEFISKTFTDKVRCHHCRWVGQCPAGPTLSLIPACTWILRWGRVCWRSMLCNAAPSSSVSVTLSSYQRCRRIRFVERTARVLLTTKHRVSEKQNLEMSGNNQKLGKRQGGAKNTKVKVTASETTYGQINTLDAFSCLSTECVDVC